MKCTYRNLFATIAVLTCLLISACASVSNTDQEGGITGTGHQKDCTETTQSCRKKQNLEID